MLSRFAAPPILPPCKRCPLKVDFHNLYIFSLALNLALTTSHNPKYHPLPLTSICSPIPYPPPLAVRSISNHYDKARNHRIMAKFRTRRTKDSCDGVRFPRPLLQAPFRDQVGVYFAYHLKFTCFTIRSESYMREAARIQMQEMPKYLFLQISPILRKAP